MDICKRCKYKSTCVASSESDFCLNYEPRPLTNYDLLISKTTKELAEWMCQTQFREGDFCPPEHGWKYCQMADGCRECWLDWLKAPVEGEINA